MIKLSIEEICELSTPDMVHMIDTLERQLEAQHQEIERINNVNSKMDEHLVRCGKELIAAEEKRADMQAEIEQLKEKLKYAEGEMETEAFDARQLRYDVEQLGKQNVAQQKKIEQLSVKVEVLTAEKDATYSSYANAEMNLEHIAGENETMRKALEKISNISNIKSWFDIQDVLLLASKTLHIVSGDFKKGKSIQKYNEPNKLYPREMGHAEKANRQLNSGDELATVKIQELENKIGALKIALALHHSMVMCGENPTELSENIFNGAIRDE